MCYLKKTIFNIIDSLQGQNIVCFDVKKKINITDTMIICTGKSNRHIISIAEDLLQKCRKMKLKYYGVEGIKTGEWVLVDLNDVIVHIMKEKCRKLYELEKLWS